MRACWFTLFGRDGLITALECLWFGRTWRGACAVYQPTQAITAKLELDADLGKIIPEMGKGEMAGFKEITLVILRRC